MKMRYPYLFKIIIVGFLLVVLAACRQEEPTPTPEPIPEPVVEAATAAPQDTASAEEVVQPEEGVGISQPIYRWGEVADRLWVLVGYGDAANPTVVTEGTVITAQFSSVEPTVNGSGGCNNYFAGYTSTDEGGLTIEGPIGSTMMFCEGVMDQEAAYFAALETVTNWALTEEGRLELTYSTGQPFEEKLVFTPGETPLISTIWRLVSWGDPEEPTPVEDDTTVTAVFSPETDNTGTVSGNATCNSYTTSYTLDGDNISFGPVAGTLALCPVGADQEAAYLSALGSAKTYAIAGANMQIIYDGGVLNFSALNLPLENVLWQAVMVGDQPVPEGVEMTALFEPGETAGEGTVGGSTGCNNFNTTYTTSDDLSTNPTTHNLTIQGPMAMTLAACPDETVAQLEQSYLGILETAETYDILGEQMVLHSANGEVQFAANRQPLVGTLWTLISLGSINNPQPPVEGSNFTALFNRAPTLPTGTVVGETGCNEYNATFAANVNEIKINLPEKTNNEDCPWGTGNFEVEQQFFLGLNAATTYRILGDILQLPYGEGGDQQVLNFVATPPPVAEAPLDLTPLANTFWYLSAIGDNQILPGTELTAQFTIFEGGTTGEISGSGGCNAYNAPIAENFAIGLIVSTQKACEPAVMDQEGGYFDWLGKAYGYSRVADQLLISTANGVLTYNSRPILDQTLELQNTTWYLISFGEVDAVAGSNPTAFFAPDGTVNGATGCNDYSGAYQTQQENLLTVGELAITQALCASDQLTTQENVFLGVMQEAASYRVSNQQLQIVANDGRQLNFSAIPPVAPVPPTAVIVSEDLGETGTEMTFDGTQSTAGSLPIVIYQWDMGDGTILVDPVIVYTYDTPGAYNVVLTVTDEAGLTGTAEKPIQISPVVQVQPPIANIAGPASVRIGEQVTFSAAGSQPGTAEITGYSWQSGDGNAIGPSTGNSFTTVYAQPGVYYPSVTVLDASGLSDTATLEIVVQAGLEGTQWILFNAIPGTTISIEFNNGTVSGFAGCNSFNASYTTTPQNGISVSTISSTGQLCPPQVMNQESNFFTALESATSFTITGNSLTITTGRGPLTFTAAAVATPAISQ